MKNYILIILIIIPSLLAAQKKLVIKAGTEYRITQFKEVHEGVITSQIDVTSHEHSLLTGTSFNYALNYKLYKNYGIGFSQSFRYSHIYYERSFSEGELISNKSVNDVITDYHFYLFKNFIFNDDHLLSVEIGTSLMNHGTKYATVKHIWDTPEGNPVYQVRTNDFQFIATKLSLGYAYKKYEIGIGAYFAQKESLDNFSTSDGFVLPFFKLNYKFIKNKN